MRGERNKHDRTTSTIVSRRAFLRTAAAALGGSRILRAAESGKTGEDLPPLRLHPGQQPSRVVQVRSSRVVEGPSVHRGRLAAMVEGALTELTGTDSLTTAWRRILKPEDLVAFKFNRSGQIGIGTTPAVVDALVGSLLSAGWEPQQVVLLEAPSVSTAKWKTATPPDGFEDAETAFASGRDQLAKVLGSVSAIVSVPYLKTHNIAGVTGAMKNLTHALVKHPARYHANGCCPYIADIFAIPAIRSKLRLCFVDGLRAVIRGGPEARPHGIRDAGYILASTDAVAVDALAVTILNQLRGESGLPRLAASAEEVPYLRDAHQKGLGIAATHGIHVVTVPAPD